MYIIYIILELGLNNPLQLHQISCKHPNSLRQFLGRHGVLIHLPTETRLVNPNPNPFVSVLGAELALYMRGVGLLELLEEGGGDSQSIAAGQG